MKDIRGASLRIKGLVAVQIYDLMIAGVNK